MTPDRTVRAAMPLEAPDHVGRALLWGLGVSILFHAVLFSPQLAAFLDPEQRMEAVAQLRAGERAKDGDRRRVEDPAKPEDRESPPPPPPRDPSQPPPPGGSTPPPKPPEGDRRQEAPEPPPIETPKPSPAYPDVEDVAIGQDEGDPMSVVIIGRDDYEEHMAQLSVVSQAGYRMSDAGGDGSVAYGRGDAGDGGGGGGSAPKSTATTVAAAAPGSPPAPEATQRESAAPAPPPDSEPHPENPPRQPDAAPAQVARADPKPQDATAPSEPVPPAPHLPASTDPAATEPLPPIDAPRDPQAKPPEATKPPPDPKDAPTQPAKAPEAPAAPAVPADQRPAAPPPVNQPPQAQPGGGVASTEKAADGPADQAPGKGGKAGGQGPSPKAGTGGKGQLSDLESPATSVVNVPAKQWRNGRLVAAVGVQLKPRQPQFTTLQMVSMLPQCQPPVVSLTFDRNGECVDVFFNRTSGDQEIDGVIRNSLLFWRAAGKKIDELKGDEKVRVTLQLLL